MNPAERRNARYYALQALYQWQISDNPVQDIEIWFLTHQISRKTDIEYFKEILHSIIKDTTSLDLILTPFLKRPLHELDMVELAVLRLSIFELKNRLDIPYRVVINEALDLTKKFGSIEGFKFINGILDQVARHLREAEMKEDGKF